MTAPRPRLFGDDIGLEAWPARLLLGLIVGVVMGILGLSVGVVRVLLYSFLHPVVMSTHIGEVTAFFLTVAPGYITAFAVAGLVLGALAGLPRNLITSALGAFLLGATLYGGIGLVDPVGAASWEDRVAVARGLAPLLGGLWAVLAVIWFLADAWKRRGSRAKGIDGLKP
jgi:hypothetical protein